MKRIQYACLEQTLRFMMKDDADPALAAQQIRAEVEHYKNQLDHTRTKYRILEEREEPDHSIILSIKKQYNGHDLGTYLDD